MNHQVQRTFIVTMGVSLLLAVPGITGLRKPTMAPVSSLINNRQMPTNFYRGFDQLDPGNASLIVSLSRQRFYVMSGREMVMDAPISSGKRRGMTPLGYFRIQVKDADHRSSVYGSFVDSKGRVVQSNVSSRIDSAPSGTHFRGAPMFNFMRLTSDGVGLHKGILPGFPCSHGCIHIPNDAADAVYPRVKVGTPVRVVQ
jgi:lipoprotein-anchoring transpeptidase ErfK/SrfK